MQGAQVPSLVGELESLMLCGQKLKKKKISWFIWNSDVTGRPVFLFAKSGSPRWDFFFFFILHQVPSWDSAPLLWTCCPPSPRGHSHGTDGSLLHPIWEPKFSRAAKTKCDFVWNEGRHLSFLTLKIPSLSLPDDFFRARREAPEPVVWWFVPSLEGDQRSSLDLGVFSPRSQTAHSSLLLHVFADLASQPDLEQIGSAWVRGGVGVRRLGQLVQLPISRPKSRGCWWVGGWVSRRGCFGQPHVLTLLVTSWWRGLIRTPPFFFFFFFFSLHGVNDFGRLRDSGSPPTSSLAECALKGLMHAYTSLLFTAAGLCRRNGEHKQKV